MEQTTTSWNEMTNNFMQTWAETGTQVWKNWFNLMGVTPTAEAVANTQPVFKQTAKRFADNQELFGRFVKLYFQAWTDIFPKVEAGEDWQQVFSNYTAQIRKQFDDFFSGTLKISQDTTQLWQIYIKETMKLNQLWMTALTSSLEPWTQTTNGTTQPWIELNNLYWDLLYEESFGSLMQSPFLGPTREFNSKLVRAFDAWTKLYQATANYQIVLANVQVLSFEELIEKLVSMAERGETVKDWRQFQDIWSQVADDVFAEAFTSDDNLQVRGNFLNALNTYRLYQQELTEWWMRALNMPVRSEVDEMHKNIYELRKEVKTLKKSLAKYEDLLAKYQDLFAKQYQPPIQE